VASTILKYPLKNPVEGDYLESEHAPTGRVDYLRIQRFRIDYAQSPSGYGGSNLPGNNISRNLDTSIAYLSMPPNLTANYGADYDQVQMGGLGVLAGQMAGSIMGAGNTADQITSALQSAASSAFPELAFNKGASITQNLGSAIGMDTGVTGNALQALTKGRIMNPFTEQVYNGIPFRNHSFTFKMFARNKKEAESILSIITYLKMGTMPQLGDTSSGNRASQGTSGRGSSRRTNANTNGFNATPTGSSSIGNGRFLRVPDRFALEFVRLDPKSDTITRLPHYRFHPCVCTNVGVNYTPDGQYVSFKDSIADLTMDESTGGNQLLVPAVELSLQFAETRIMTQNDVVAGF
jgi:hypothetical protein